MSCFFSSVWLLIWVENDSMQILYEAPNYALIFSPLVLIVIWMIIHVIRTESLSERIKGCIIATVVGVIYFFFIIPKAYVINHSVEKCERPRCEVISGYVYKIEAEEDYKKNIVNKIYISNDVITIGKIGGFIGYQKTSQDGSVIEEGNDYDLYVYNSDIIKYD